MIRAYDEALLPYACDALGRMLDYSAYSLRIDPDSMMKLFIGSGTAALFGRGDIHSIAGMSGIELAYEVLEKSGLSYERVPARHTVSLSSEYWCGHALAYAQWATGLCFGDVLELRPASALIAGFTRERLSLLEKLPLDISDDDKAAALRRFGEDFARSFADRLLCPAAPAGASASVASASGAAAGSNMTSLKKMRVKNGLSQSALAKAAGVPLRTIQQYEQRQKDINRANLEYIIMLSRALHCEPADLLEDPSLRSG